MNFLEEINNPIIFDSFIKAKSVLSNNDHVLVSVSGGSDSDCVIDIIERVKREGQEVKYVWIDTGLEYQATKDHLKYLEQRYGIEILRYRAIKPIPLVVKTYGIPFVAKIASQYIEALQTMGFKFEDKSDEEIYAEYGKNYATRWWTGEDNKGFKTTVRFTIQWNTYLKEFLIENPPTFNISAKCCYYSKKKLLTSSTKTWRLTAQFWESEGQKVE